MVIITLRNGDDWYKANWVFRQLAEDVVETYPQDVELKFLMEQAEAVGGLSLDSMEEDRASKTLQAIRKVAEETIKGRIPGWKRKRPDDEAGQRMYLKSLAELLELIGKDVGTSDGEKGTLE